MYKKELRSLKRINATPHMRRVAQRNKLAVPIKYINSWEHIKDIVHMLDTLAAEDWKDIPGQIRMEE